jgi:hypothetical protein
VSTHFSAASHKKLAQRESRRIGCAMEVTLLAIRIAVCLTPCRADRDTGWSAQVNS